MANETVAPTNGTASTEAHAKNLTELELDFVTVVHQRYLLSGELMTESEATELGINTELWFKFVKSEPVKNALVERGVEWPPVGTLSLDSEEGTTPEEWRHTGLTPRQLIVANSLLDLTDQRSNKKKLQDMGVSTHQYNTWLRSPKFSGYLKARAEQLMGSHQHEARLALLDRVQSGDLRAIQFYLEMTGEYVPVTAQQNSNAAFDLQSVIVNIVEIITEEVHDPETALRISERMKSLITSRQIAGELIEPGSVTKPEIAQARHLTPELQALMAKGGGNT